MKRFITYLVMLFAAVVVAKGAETTPAERWEVGNKAYIEGKYNDAAVAYRSILEGGEYSVELYYNLANAYFKMDSIGKAILYYNKALRIDPSSADIEHNLALAEAKTKDRIKALPEFFLTGWLKSIRNGMSCMAWSIISILLLAAFLASTLLFLLASQIGLRKGGFYGALCSFVLFVAATLFAISSRNDMLSHDEAVVMISAIAVKSSPDRSASDLFVLHEGTKLKVVAEMDEWCEIVIADGKKGWTERKNIEEI